MEGNNQALIRLLGSIDVVHGKGTESVGGARPRRLLARLAVAGGLAVTEPELSDAVWGDDQPSNVRAALQNNVYRLRSVLGPDAIIREHGGYALRTVSTDIERFDAHRDEGLALRSGGQLTAAELAFSRALGLWRGNAFGDLADLDWVRPEASRLEEQRLLTHEDLLEVQLALGEHVSVLSEATQLSAEHPLRERLTRILMEALHAAGRQAEALRAGEAYRQLLATQTGLEPSQALREVEQRVLSDQPDPSPQGGDRHLGAYVLEELVGEGAFGSIYRATQPAVGRDVAIKVVRPELANDPEFIRRFEVEAQLVARLEHPHVVPLYDYWREPGGAYLVMRYLSGGSAEQLLVREGALPLPIVSRLVDEIGGALARAHQEGVVHRDVKPGNILFDDAGHSYLADFGISTAVGLPGRPDLPAAGSPLYAAPEQIRDGEFSEQSDIYALAVVIHELLLGRAAFSDSASVSDLMGRKLREPIPAVHSQRPEVPDAVDTVLQVATSTDPAQRFPSVADLVVAFRDAVVASAGATTSTSPDIDHAPRRAAVQTLMSVQIEDANPYLGLAAFDEADATDFHGRDDLVATLESCIENERFVVVVGPSGSGKSSVVRAGLVPRLRERGSFVTSLVPGEFPLDELETALHRVSSSPLEGVLADLERDDRALHRLASRIAHGDSDLVLVVDQFEELFTHSRPDQRSRFLALIEDAVTASRARLRVIATLRADFYDRPLQEPIISELVRANTQAVTPLTSRELGAAIQEPAERLGVTVEPALVGELTSHVTANPASLPLMQYVLTELFDRREGGVMTMTAYEAIGGLTGALAARADTLVTDLGETEVRRLFTRLVTPGEGTEDTRRRVLRSELTSVEPRVIEEFGDARLLTHDSDPATREPTVEVAHEAIIREWPRLRRWLDEDRDGLRLMRQLGAAATSWVAADHDVSELYRGARLEAAVAWSESRGDDLTEVEQAFLAASVELAETERAREERRARRLRVLLGATAAIAVLALLAGAVAFQQFSRADSEAETARSARFDAETRRLASEAGFRVRTDRQVGLLLAAESHRRDPRALTVGALQRALINIDTYAGTIDSGTPSSAVSWIDDDTLVAVGPRGVSVLGVRQRSVSLATDTPARVDLIDVGDAALLTFAFVSSAGGRVALVPDGDAGTVAVTDIDQADVSQEIVHAEPVHGLALSPDGRLLATIDASDTLRMVDLESGEIVWEVDAHPERIFEELRASDEYEPVQAYMLDDPGSFTIEKDHHRLLFSADGTQLATQESVLRRWDVQTGDKVGRDVLLWRRRQETGDARVVSHPSVTFLSVWRGDSVMVHDHGGLLTVDIEDGSVRTTAEVAGAGDFLSLAKIDTVHWDGSDTAWALLTDGHLAHVSVGDGRPVRPAIDTQAVAVSDLAVSPDGRLAAIASGSGVHVFALDGSRAIARAVPRNGTNFGTITPDGATLTQDHADFIGVFDPGTVVPLDADVASPSRPDGLVLFHYTPSAPNMLFAVTSRYQMQLWDLSAEAPLGPVVDLPGWHGEAATQDNELVAVGSGFGVRVYEVDSGDEVAQFDEVGDYAPSVSFSTDDSRLAAAGVDGTAAVWDTRTWEPLPALGDGAGSVKALRYSPDGRWLVTMDGEGNLALRDPVTHVVEERLVGSGSVDIADGVFFFSDDGRYLVTGADGAARLWDLDQGAEIGDPFPNDADNRIGGADGQPWFVTAVGDHHLIWELDIATWPELACDLAGRNLTLDEWDQFGPQDQPYRPTCPQWPGAPEIAVQPADQESVSATPTSVADPAVGSVDLVALGDRAADEVMAALGAGAEAAAEELCEAWEQRLVDASDTRAEIASSPVGRDRRHRFWTIDIAVHLCAGKGFDTARVYLESVLDNPDGVCIGYPSPCPTPRRWPE